MLDDVSPPESPGGATAMEAAASLVVVMAEDEASLLRAQLEAIQEAIATSEWEVAATMASHAEAQA